MEARTAVDKDMVKEELGDDAGAQKKKGKRHIPRSLPDCMPRNDCSGSCHLTPHSIDGLKQS